MATLILRPNAAGDETNWSPDSGSNYARVNESSQDGDTSYVERTSTIANDLYNIDDDGSDVLNGATISQIEVFATAKQVAAGAMGSNPSDCTLNLIVKPSGGSVDIDGGATIVTGKHHYRRHQ